MKTDSHDLTIDEILTDPVIGAAMRADRVDPRAVEALLRGAADARRRRERCLSLPFARLRAARPWTGLPVPSATDRGASCSW